MTHKLRAGFTAALALSAGLMGVPPAEAATVVVNTASTAAAAAASAAATAAAAAARAQRIAAYNAAMSSAIANPVTQNIEHVTAMQMGWQYAPYAVECQKRANRGKVTDAAHVTSSMIATFETCVQDANAIGIATAIGEIDATAEGMQESYTPFLAECQVMHGITPGHREGVNISQAWDTVKCAEDAGKAAWRNTYLYPTLGGIAGAATLLGLGYGLKRRRDHGL